jgi:pyruvate dehydrogenase E1 component beta subunit
MPVMTYRDALRSAMAEEMERDESVRHPRRRHRLYGGTHLGRPTRCSTGFGPKRVIDTPIAEGGLHRRRDRDGDGRDAARSSR